MKQYTWSTWSLVSVRKMFTGMIDRNSECVGSLNINVYPFTWSQMLFKYQFCARCYAVC